MGNISKIYLVNFRIDPKNIISWELTIHDQKSLIQRIKTFGVTSDLGWWLWQGIKSAKLIIGVFRNLDSEKFDAYKVRTNFVCVCSLNASKESKSGCKI